MFYALQIKVYELIDRSTVEKTQDLGERQAGGGGPDKWGADSPAGQERHSALVQLATS
jgi:hypothetical protein